MEENMRKHLLLFLFACVAWALIGGSCGDSAVRPTDGSPRGAGSVDTLAVTIGKPPDSETEGVRFRVQGTVSDPNEQVEVLVHPMPTDFWWVQTRPAVDGAGKWQTLVHLGTPTAGIGHAYEIIAVAAPKSKLKVGDTLEALPEAATKSNIITVLRTK